MDEIVNNSDLQFIFVGGKGGVGKTTSSCGLSIQRALAQQRNGATGKTLLISTDPAHNLSDAFQQQFGGAPVAVTGCDILDEAGIVLECMEVDPEAVMQKEFGEVTDGLQDEMVKDFRSWITSVPGIDEAIVLAHVVFLALAPALLHGDQARRGDPPLNRLVRHVLRLLLQKRLARLRGRLNKTDVVRHPSPRALALRPAQEQQVLFRQARTL